MEFGWTSGKRSPRSQGCEVGTLLIIEREGYLILDALLQGGTIFCQHRIEINGGRVKTLAICMRCDKRIDALHMRC